MPIQTKVSGAFKTATPSVRVGGSWKAANAFVRVGGAWKSAAVQKVATPQIASVNYPGAPGDMTAYVTLSCATVGATIYTSVNGGAWITYGSVVIVPHGNQLRAYATKSGMTDSDIFTTTFF